MQPYQTRRREILAELIYEYIEDSDYDARRIYEEFLCVLASEVQGREESSKKAIEIRDLVLGQTVSITSPTSYEY